MLSSLFLLPTVTLHRQKDSYRVNTDEASSAVIVLSRHGNDTETTSRVDR